MSDNDLLSSWARALIDAIAAAGVSDVVVSPGSRSTPFVCAALSQEGLRCHSVIDERSAAFFALGQSKATGVPTLLICTSGTAGAHYLPAVIEAEMAYAPLLVLTADRPPELVGCGASQTIDQRELFGRHVRGFFDLGVPGADQSAMLRTVQRATALSVGPCPGAVHLNAAAAKPLEPTYSVARPEPATCLPRGGAAAPTRFAASRLVPGDDAIGVIANACDEAARGLIACGPADLRSVAVRRPLFELARATGFAVYAEATSQLRFAGAKPPGVDVAARLDRMAARPDLILQVGASPVSAAWSDFADVRRFVVAAHGSPDPLGTAEMIMSAEPADALWALTARLAAHRQRRWCSGAAQVDTPSSVEGLLAAAVVDAMPAGGTLMVGNSGPVRHLDEAVRPFANDLRVLHQRGVAGIDGLVSGAAGAASVLGEPVTLLLGDVSFLHDIGGLWAARQVQSALPIVVLDNDGGRIFDRLPIAEVPMTEAQRRFWTTPPSIDLAHCAAAFALPYTAAETPAALRKAVRAAYRTTGPTIIGARITSGDLGVET